MKTTAVNMLVTLCAVLIAATIVLLPFHALVTVWAGSNTAQYDLFRLWVELILLIVAPLAGLALYKDAKLRTAWRGDALVWVCAGYVVWQLALGVWALHAGQVNHTALLDGWATDLRFPAFMLACWIIATRRVWLAARWRELLLIPAAAVTAFGLLQAFVLPADILKHVGYGPRTIPPFETVDQKMAYVRVQSTLRGPNPLGAYLALVIPALGASLLTRRRLACRIRLAVFLTGVLVVLGFTYSRSAYVGALLTLAAICWLLLRSQQAKVWLLVAVGSLVLLSGGVFVALRHNDQFQNTFFHTDEHSQAAHSSNQDRSTALAQGLRDVVHQPFGRGAGSAGPASAHNNHPARIAENYYLQVGQESGWLGLGLFLALNVLVTWKLWQRRTQQLPAVLLASFAGLTCINLLSHAWADDSLGMLWWGFAGIAFSLPLASAPKAAKRYA